MPTKIIVLRSSHPRVEPGMTGEIIDIREDGVTAYISKALAFDDNEHAPAVVFLNHEDYEYDEEPS
jgi:hypothetical protein